MSNFKPSYPYNTAMYLLIPKSEIVRGVPVKTYPEPTEGILIYCSFKSYGGTESNSNGVVAISDTVNIETWYRPEIKADCRLCLAQDVTEVYEILGKPENINMRNQHLKFKIQSVRGGV